jgi:hypothetical protein
MKNYVKPLQKALVFLLSTVLLFSCNQIETFEGPDLNEAQARIPVQFKPVNFNARVEAGYTACGTPETHKLMAGQNIPVGEVTVFNEGDIMYVTVSIEKGDGFDGGDWFIRKIQAYFGQVEYDFVAKGKKGIRNPAPGKFPINETIELDYGVADQVFTYELEISNELREFGEFDVAVHAEVVRVENLEEINGVWTADVMQTEGAWAGNQRFNPDGQGNWATYMSYSIQDCEVPCQDEWLRYTSYTDTDAIGVENEETVESESFIVKDVGVVEFQRVRTNLAGSARRYTITIDYYILPELIAQGYSFEEFTAFTKGRLEEGATLDSETVSGTHTSGQIVLTYDIPGGGLNNQGQNFTYWQGFNAKLNGFCNP